MSTGVCDDGNNNAFCSWDGGDCCASPKISNVKQFRYCKACACLDCTDKDFQTCIVSGKRVKCKGASTTTTTRLSTRARARTTTTTTSTTTPERTRSKSTSSAPAKVTTTVSRTTATTTTTTPFVSQKRDKCVKVAKGKCGSVNIKGDGE